ncbi:hypothetical protein HELRODRAFT_184379 [Helobdella robusta]|uniref:Uncharacterized protein n=1 Tax=Helobdella robusta TaxID=6412 RepID=T1FL33_HELRO|nr:hypothetical protein HELRODRAFT_184379 [Helobdella robusta]ESN99887.1 hypothetical protein HELRODRAFT_184379 [Helobdella robusta]
MNYGRVGRVRLGIMQEATMHHHTMQHHATPHHTKSSAQDKKKQKAEDMDDTLIGFVANKCDLLTSTGMNPNATNTETLSTNKNYHNDFRNNCCCCCNDNQQNKRRSQFIDGLNALTHNSCTRDKFLVTKEFCNLNNSRCNTCNNCNAKITNKNNSNNSNYRNNINNCTEDIMNTSDVNPNYDIKNKSAKNFQIALVNNVVSDVINNNVIIINDIIIIVSTIIVVSSSSYVVNLNYD